jgi:hypothetical protein
LASGVSSGSPAIALLRLAVLVAGHAEIGVVDAGIDADPAGEVHLGDLVPLIGDHVGVAVGAGKAVLHVLRRRVLSVLQVFRDLLGAMAARADRRDLLLLVPVVERLRVAGEVPFPELDRRPPLHGASNADSGECRRQNHDRGRRDSASTMTNGRHDCSLSARLGTGAHEMRHDDHGGAGRH